MFSVEFADDIAKDSISFLPTLFGETIQNPRDTIVHHSVNGRFSIRQGNWKLLLAPGSGGRTSPTDIQATQQGLPIKQLYNLKVDLSETTNLVMQHPEKATRLLAQLESYVTKGRSTPGPDQKNDVDIDIWKHKLNQPKPEQSNREPKNKNRNE